MHDRELPLGGSDAWVAPVVDRHRDLRVRGEMSYHAARALLADEASSNAAGMGLVNVSIEESYQVNEDAFHDRIIKVRNPGQPNVCASDGARVFPLTDFPGRGLPTPTRAHLSLSKTPRSTPIAQEVTADESHELVAAFSMTVMLTILLLVIILGATIKHYNITWLHQSGAALLLGTIVGFVVWYVRRDPMYQDNGTGESQRMTSFVEWIMFDTEFFFLVLLPPVIFESGYTLNPRLCFEISTPSRSSPFSGRSCPRSSWGSSCTAPGWRDWRTGTPYGTRCSSDR